MNHFVKGNPDLCIGCRTCIISCVVAHEGLEIFHMDPDSYSFNPKLHMVKTAKISIPVQCKHCESPACMAVCPEKCISMVDGAVVIRTEQCVGCKTCMVACPFGAIDMVAVTGAVQADGTPRMVANKCDLCQGLPGGPSCVSHCPTGALAIVSEDDLCDIVESRRIASAASLVETKNFK